MFVVLVFLGGFFFVVVILEYYVGMVMQVVYSVVCFGYYVGVECWIVIRLYVVFEYEVLLDQQVQFIGDIEECVVFVIVVVLIVQYVYVGIVCGGQFVVDVCRVYLCWEYVKGNYIGVFGEDWYVVDYECEVLVVVVIDFVLQFYCVQFDVLFYLQGVCCICGKGGMCGVVCLFVLFYWLLVMWCGQYYWYGYVVVVCVQGYMWVELVYYLFVWIDQFNMQWCCFGGGVFYLYCDVQFGFVCIQVVCMYSQIGQVLCILVFYLYWVLDVCCDILWVLILVEVVFGFVYEVVDYCIFGFVFVW